MAFVVDSNVAIMFSTNGYKGIMASQLWACSHQWSYSYDSNAYSQNTTNNQLKVITYVDANL